MSGGVVDRPRSFTRLEDETRVDPVPGGLLPGWHATAYPTAGEAVAFYVPPPSQDGGPSTWSELSEDEREAENEKRAVRRAKKEMRLYMVANGLRYMWVLTLAGSGLHGADGRREIMRRVGRFVRLLRESRGGAEFPYLYSPELHPGGHGWHVNFFVASRMDQGRMAALWGQVEADGDAPCGFVWVKDWVRKNRRKGASAREGIRNAARYGAKYASKDWAQEVLVGGQHRYEKAQGFAPKVVGRWGHTRDRIVWELLAVFQGVLPAETWRSEEAEGWRGPPVMCMRWP